ncbi:uncharacterized protein LOC115919774 [Strongylocentrotus purpuratus]|uniref:Uncharacterized protein n=1 Tax=Strongylocentrotus purpuratus TaxID=7668 RepID=A0A7M7N2T0_STRPU|nr:uncharacterized protein LOC115919774 [Strongylocentrotus purpuratus]
MGTVCSTPRSTTAIEPICNETHSKALPDIKQRDKKSTSQRNFHHPTSPIKFQQESIDITSGDTPQKTQGSASSKERQEKGELSVKDEEGFKHPSSRPVSGAAWEELVREDFFKAGADEVMSSSSKKKNDGAKRFASPTHNWFRNRIKSTPGRIERREEFKQAHKLTTTGKKGKGFGALWRLTTVLVHFLKGGCATIRNFVLVRDIVPADGEDEGRRSSTASG